MEKMLGMMLDCSRNGVLKVEAVKRYANIIKKMGYNTLMLYTEDTYEVDNQPLFGHLRGRYTKEELKEMDAYCAQIGIELVPCIQTLAHLNCMFKWLSKYGEVNDCDDILLCGDDKTYALIEDMFSSLSQCFSSKKIHIGMDEAYRVGTGKYQQIHGIEDRFDIINGHLHKVCALAEKYGFEPMIWSDMFRKLALDIDDQYADADDAKIQEKAKLPENVSLIYWDYYTEDYDRYAKMIKTNKLFGRKVYFAGGIWTWKGFAPDNAYSMSITKPAMRACREEGVDGVFFTAWGDDGAECSPFAALPAAMYAAECARGNEDLDSIKEKFKAVTGCDFDSFLLFDKLDTLGGKHMPNPGKYLFYQDIFMGMRDFMCSGTEDAYYEALAKQIKAAQGKGEFAYLFDAYEALAEVLATKSCLGIRIRKAYLARDMESLRQTVKDCDVLIEKLKRFHAVHQNRWVSDNKPHGFDVQDIRIGGLMQRVISCKTRLEKFICGEIDEIPELDEPVADVINGNNRWGRLVSPNVITHTI